MGFTPAQVGAMSLWEFAAAFAGWRKANSAPSGPNFPTPEEHAAAVERATLH